MKIKFYTIIPIAVLLLFFISSCDFSPSNLNVPNLESDVLGPLVNTAPNAQQIVQLQKRLISYNVNFSDFLSTTGFDTIPPLTVPFTFPTYSFLFSNVFKYADFDGGLIYMNIINNFPVNIKQGTVITLRNLSNSSLVSSDTITSDINPGVTYQMNPPINLQGLHIEDSLELIVSNFTTDGAPNGIQVNPGMSFTMNARLYKPLLADLFLTNNQSLDIHDTSAFNLRGTKIKTNAVSGDLTIYLDNGLPLNFSLQFYFLNQYKQPIAGADSLFDNGNYIPSANTDGNGHVLLSGIVSSQLGPISVDSARLANLSTAKYMISAIHMKTVKDSTGVLITKDEIMKLLLVGDLKINILR